MWLGFRAASVSMASGSGLLDTARCAWDDELAAVLDIDTAALGDITPEPELLPAVTADYVRRWPRLVGMPWRAPLGDGASSNAGAGCLTGARLALMVGTSGALRRCAPTDATVPLAPGIWRYRLDRRHVLTGGALSDGGSAYAWLRETLALPDDDALEAALLTREPGEHGIVMLPFWSGERSTGWVGDATAVVAGIKRHTTALDLFQAAIEAVTYRFVLLFDALRGGGETLVATGGGLLNSPAWMQLIADAAGTPVVASAVPEASLRGAALVALREVGLASDAEIAAAPLGKAYQPRPERYDLYRAAIARQQTLYEREVGPDGVNLLARQTR
jgi:gluconokinase